jgi:hypothetical protein
MKNIISSRLLGNVLGCECTKSYFEDNHNLVHYFYEYDVTWSELRQHQKDTINIYELAHKCKEWALKHDCELLSCVKSTRSICDIYSNLLDCKFTHYADSEPEAIFKACEWILNETNKHKYS